MLTGHGLSTTASHSEAFSRSPNAHARTPVCLQEQGRGLYTQNLNLPPMPPAGRRRCPRRSPPHTQQSSPRVLQSQAAGLEDSGRGRPSGTLLTGAGRGRAALSFARAAALRGANEKRGVWQGCHSCSKC